ncbi:hypothetical protein BDW75DRAFT_211439 [Aspergillus navahoensis]
MAFLFFFFSLFFLFPFSYSFLEAASYLVIESAISVRWFNCRFWLSSLVSTVSQCTHVIFNMVFLSVTSP